jgi:DNA-directed RNA polymerase omega subunit
MAEHNEMTEEEIEEFLKQEFDPPEIDSKYRKIILAAQRSKQLQRGAIPRSEVDLRTHKATTVAMRELSERKVNWRYTDTIEADGAEV